MPREQELTQAVYPVAHAEGSAHRVSAPDTIASERRLCDCRGVTHPDDESPFELPPPSPASLLPQLKRQAPSLAARLGEDRHVINTAALAFMAITPAFILISWLLGELSG